MWPHCSRAPHPAVAMTVPCCVQPRLFIFFSSMIITSIALIDIFFSRSALRKCFSSNIVLYEQQRCQVAAVPASVIVATLSMEK